MNIRETAQEYKRYTCEEIESWETDERFELIDGVIHMMSPPTRTHQKISGEIFNQLYNFLKGKTCEVYSAPFAVYLGDNDTRVEPDIIVVCDKSKLTDKGCKGAPDLVIEILSPTTSKHDRITKFNKYMAALVREYWIVDPADKAISVYVLENNKYFAYAYGDADVITVSVLRGCQINTADVFNDS